MSEKTEVAELSVQELMPANADFTSTTSLVMDRESMQSMMLLAETMACGAATIPKHLQGNASDCLAIVMQSMQWKMNPFAVAQKTHLVNGQLGYEAQLVIAVINSRAPITGRMKFRWEGDWSKAKDKNCKDPTLKAIASATLNGDDLPTELEISMAQVGVRNSPNWESDPRQQLAYLAAKKWARLHCPDVIMGVYTPDELDGAPQIRDVGPRSTPAQIAEKARGPIDAGSKERKELVERLEKLAIDKGADALQVEWSTKLTKEQRKLLGVEERDRIKGLAPVPVDEKLPEGKTESAGPTYAELMDRIKSAKSVDDLAQCLSDSTALPADQQGEIKSACDARAKEFGNG